MKKIYSLLLLLIPIISFGQYTVTDAAVTTSCNCFEISNAATPNTVGSFYNNTPIDLSTDLNLKFVVNFGCDNFGGEGMAFLMQSGPWTVGNAGLGLGYQGVANSLAIEFDTRDNFTSGEYPAGLDTPPDHVSIQSNGVIDHNPANYLGTAGPVNIIATGTNDAEDCLDHDVEIIWLAGAQTMDVLIDGVSIYAAPQNVGDIVNTIYGGNPNVLWGWTGTAGVAANTQTVCIALEPEFTYTATNCPGQQIDFTGSYWSNSNIVSYAWDFGGLGTSNLQNPSFTFNTVGEYAVELTITDDTGCSNTDTIDIGVGFDVNITADNLSVCPDGTSQLNVIAQPYVGNDCCFVLTLTDTWDSWNNEIEIFVDGVTIGTYDITGAATGGAVVQTQDLCFPQGAVIEVEIIGQQNQFESGYSIADETGAILIEVLPGLTWIDGDIQTFTVDCGLTNVAYSYHWNANPTLTDYSSSNPIATVPVTTYYVVGVTDPNTGCTITDSIQITTTTPVTAQISGTDLVCQGETGDLTVTFTGSGPYDFDYTDPNNLTTTVTNITANPYTLPVTIDGNYTLNSVIGNGCTGTIDTSGPDGGIGELEVVIPPTVTIETSASYCEGDPLADLTVTSTNGGIVNWYTNAALTGTPIGNGNIFTPPTTTVSTTTYYAQEVETVSGINCAGPSDNVIITINAIPNAPLVSGNTIYCQGDTPTPLSAEMSLNGTPNWYDNSALTPPTVSTLLQYNPTLNVGIFCYYVNETAAGCTGDSTEICVETKPTPLAPALTGTTTYCEGDTPTALTAAPTVGGNITWFNAAPTTIATGLTYTPDLTLGNQTFTASESLNGCTGPMQSISITVNILPTVDVVESVSICYGDSIKLTATHNNFDLLWSNGATTESTWYGPFQSTTYYITATNPLCGSVSDSVRVYVNSLPYVIAGNDTVIGIGGEATLSAWSPTAIHYSWTPDVNECISNDCREVYVIPNQATVYIVDVIDANTCHNYDTVLVDISGFMEVFVPNIFSPNGDGINDFLVINGPRLFNYTIEIFDRYGKLVYTAYEQKDYWDGKYQGSELSTQTFVYSIVGETVLGEKLSLSGNVTIIK